LSLDQQPVTMTSEVSHCSACGANLEERTITYTLTKGDEVYIVENVTAWICSQCGEQYLASDTLDAIQDQIEHGQPIATRQVPVYRVPQPRP
jgi:YgiT-type zinc finger domain-containing protein